MSATPLWPKLRNNRHTLSCALTLLGTALLAATATCNAQPVAASSAGTEVVKLMPGMTIGTLSSRRDTDLVELSSGRRVRVSELRRLDAWGKKARSVSQRPIPAALQARPASSGRPVDNAGDLAEALKRPDAETIQFPNGQRATVGQIRFLRPLIEQRLGRPLSDVPQRPKLSGRARKVSASTDWKEVLQQSDSSVLESPGGTRITVGELKQYFAKTRPARSARSPRGPAGRPADPAATERR